MYLNPQIHDTQDTFPVAPEIRIMHVFRMCIPYVSRMYLDYLLGYMYSACILHVSRMSPSYQIRRSLDAFEIHVSHDVYFRCIPHVSWSPLQIHVSRMYPDASQMYLTRPVTFQENTCILTFCMYFTRIPNESKIHFGIHIRYIKIHVSWALPWCHTGYMSGYIRIRVSWTLHHDTSGYTEIQNRR